MVFDLWCFCFGGVFTFFLGGVGVEVFLGRCLVLLLLLFLICRLGFQKIVGFFGHFWCFLQSVWVVLSVLDRFWMLLCGPLFPFLEVWPLVVFVGFFQRVLTQTHEILGQNLTSACL